MVQFDESWCKLASEHSMSCQQTSMRLAHEPRGSGAWPGNMARSNMCSAEPRQPRHEASRVLAAKFSTYRCARRLRGLRLIAVVELEA
jgi:hypothetical protein